MTVKNIGQNSYLQYFVGLSTDTKPTKAYIGDVFEELDSGKKFKFDGTNWILNVEYKPITENVIFEGTSTDSGSATEIVDKTKNFELDSLNGKTIKFTVGGIDYIRTIISCDGDTLEFAPTSPKEPSSATLTGSADGSLTIHCIADDPNSYSVIAVAGSGEGASTTVTLEDKLLVITSPTDGDGNPTDIMPGNVHGIIQGTTELAELFYIGEEDYIAGIPIDIIDEPVSFTGGTDGVIVPKNTKYIVF